MKTFRSSRGPFKERPYYSAEEVESMCLDELRKVGLLPSEPSPIRIDRFIEKRFKIVPSYETLPDGVLGLTQFSDAGPLKVVVSEALEQDPSVTNDRRIRSTLGHEAGHCMLHSHLFAFTAKSTLLFGDNSDPRGPRVLCREPQKTGGDWWEFQANLVMSTILLPYQLVRVSLMPFLQPSGLLGTLHLPEDQRRQATRALAEVFNVNPIMVRIRLEKLYPAHGQSFL